MSQTKAELIDAKEDFTISGTTPTLTIGDAGTEDTKIVFDGNAQDFYIGLDDSADDLIIGLGSTVGTTPIISVDENKLSTFSGAITVGVDDTGHDVKFFGATASAYMLWDESADDLVLAGAAGIDLAGDIDVDGTANLDVVDIDGAVDMASTLQVDGKITGSGDMLLNGTTPTLTIGDAGTEDTKIVFDGNAQDFYIGLDDSADDLVIGLGSTVGTTPAISIADDLTVNLHHDTVITNDDNQTTLTITSTHANQFAAPILKLYRNSSSPADDDQIGYILFDGRNDNSQDVTYYKILSHIDDASDGTEDANVQHQVMTGGSLQNYLSMNSGEIVINDGSIDIDFRVESNDEANFFVIDAGDNVAGIGTTGSTVRFYIQNASSSNTSLILQNTHASNASVIQANDSVRAANSAYSFFRGNSSNGADVEFHLRGDGTAYADGTWEAGGADYAEYFEWKDGNSSSEDRRGFSVVLDGNKIVASADSDDASKIIGVISSNPSVVGDGAWNKWNQKHLKDDYGTYIYEDYTQTEWKETFIIEGVEEVKEHSYQTDLIPDDVTVPDDAIVTVKDNDGNNLQRRKVNPDWNKTQTYLSREDRKEWDTVGMMGKLRMKKGQKTGTNWIKMRDISDSVEEWLVR